MIIRPSVDLLLPLTLWIAPFECFACYLNCAMFETEAYEVAGQMTPCSLVSDSSSAYLVRPNRFVIGDCVSVQIATP